MTKGEAIKTVEDWLLLPQTPTLNENTYVVQKPPMEAIRRVLREAKAK